MRGDVAWDVVCPVERACSECRIVIRSEEGAEDHVDRNPTHIVGPCGVVLHPRQLAVHSEDPRSSPGKQTRTAESTIKHAVRQHLYQRHPGLTPREVSLYLDKCAEGTEREAGPSQPPLEIGTASDQPGPSPPRPLSEARAAGRADPLSVVQRNKISGTVVARATSK